MILLQWSNIIYNFQKRCDNQKFVVMELYSDNKNNNKR